MASLSSLSSASSASSSAPSSARSSAVVDAATARAWLAGEGFAEGDLRSEKLIRTGQKTCPMAWACYKGNLAVCKWLFAHGAAADITKANNGGFTPMFIACDGGHLSVCKWLYEVGAAADVTKAYNNGFTPMYVACQNGHLSVCKWLFEAGAAADITRMVQGWAPLKIAFHHDHISICHFLILNGALSDPDPEGDDDHVDRDIVERDVRPAHNRPALLAWAQAAVATSVSFRGTIVLGTFAPEGLSTAELLRRTLIAGSSEAQTSIVLKYIPDEDQRALLHELRPVRALSKLRGQPIPLKLIADFLGVLHGRALRIVHELANDLRTSI